MEYVTLKKNNTKKVLLVLMVFIAIVTSIVFVSSRAKYQVTQSVQIVNGTINYKPYDFKIVGIFKENDQGKYDEVNEIPEEEGYIIDRGKSKCMINDEEQDTDAVLKTVNGINTFGNLQKMDKCTLYFKKETISDKTLEKLNLKSNGPIGNITGPSCDSDSNCGNEKNMSQNGVYEAEDDYGTSYVFRGAVDNNWVKFGKISSNNKDIWWRIIRINGNGTVRLIYAGAVAADSNISQSAIKSSESEIQTSFYKTSPYNDNKYVGFRFGTGSGSQTDPSTYGDISNTGNDSTIKIALDTWWAKTNLGNKTDNIDVETGFCNDRGIAPIGTRPSYTGNGSGTDATAYASWGRLYTNNSWKSIQEPSLKCANPTRDLFTGQNSKEVIKSDGSKIEGNKQLRNPVGLITSDEVVFAGGFGGQNNNGYWLDTDRGYWTMSPSGFSGSRSYVLVVDSNGILTTMDVYGTSYGVRPVINLKTDTVFTFNDSGQPGGTIENPYVVS